MKIPTMPDGYQAGFGEALVDPSVLMPLYRWTAEGKPLGVAGILALFQFSEGAVLNETLVFPGSWRYPPPGARKPGLWCTALDWIGGLSQHVAVHQDLISFSVDYGIYNDACFDRAFSFCSRLESVFGDDWRGLEVVPFTELPVQLVLVLSDTLNMFHRVWAWNCPFVANPFWEGFFVTEEARLKPPPQRLYDVIDGDLRRQVEDLQQEGAPIPLYVPPIPAMVLSRCSASPESYWRELLGLRAEFAAVRKKLRLYHEAIANPGNASLGELIRTHDECFKEVEAALRDVGRPRDRRMLLELWQVASSVGPPGTGVELVLTVGKSVGRLIAAASKWIRVRGVRGRARNFFDLPGKVRKIRGYGQLIESKLGVDTQVLSSEIRALEQHLARVQRARTGRQGTSDERSQDD